MKYDLLTEVELIYRVAEHMPTTLLKSIMSHCGLKEFKKTKKKSLFVSNRSSTSKSLTKEAAASKKIDSIPF